MSKTANPLRLVNTVVSNRPMPPGGLLNELIDDAGIGYAALVLAAYKAAGGPGFALHADDVRGRLGMSRGLFKPAVCALEAQGWLTRKRSSKGRALGVDRLVFRSESRRGVRSGYLSVKPDWFARLDPSAEGRLRPKEFAVWIFVQSKRPELPATIDDVAERFGFSREFASKCLRMLARAGVIHRVGKTPGQMPGGRYYYSASPPSASHGISI